MNEANIHLEKTVAHIEGVIDFDTVVLLRQQGERSIREQKSLIFDFQAVTHANSAGLALMLRWSRYAKTLGKTIQFNHLPVALKIIAEVCGVSKIIGMK